MKGKFAGFASIFNGKASANSRKTLPLPNRNAQRIW
jgi:hypothetical protein